MWRLSPFLLATSVRFEGAPKVDLTEFQTILMPYPRIHVVLYSFAPIIIERLSVAEITMSVLEPAAMYMKGSPVTPSVMPSLQQLGEDSVPVMDTKCDGQDRRET